MFDFGSPLASGWEPNGTPNRKQQPPKPFADGSWGTLWRSSRIFLNSGYPPASNLEASGSIFGAQGIHFRGIAHYSPGHTLPRYSPLFHNSFFSLLGIFFAFHVGSFYHASRYSMEVVFGVHSELFHILDGFWAFVGHNLVIRTTFSVSLANIISMHHTWSEALQHDEVWRP